MSEYINNTQDRLSQLIAFAERLINGENGNMLIGNFKEYIETVNSAEAMQVFDALLIKEYPFEVVKKNVGKLVNVFFKSLDSHQWNKPAEGHFLYYMMLENREMEKRMDSLRPLIKNLMVDKEKEEYSFFREMLSLVQGLKEYELHYIKKENILFSWLEKTFPEYRCIKLMWSFDDDFRKSIRILESLLTANHPDKALLNKEFGKLFFTVLPLIFREEQIVFPVAMRAIPVKVWDDMMLQSFETGWAFGITPKQEGAGQLSNAGYGMNDGNSGLNHDTLSNELVDLRTGFLNAEQLILIFDNLPVDITFVDEHDEVKYFSGEKHRIFPRSKAIIGRKVQNCHPPESVHIVNQIVEDFRTGQRDHADFWINMRGRFIHIRYFALRNDMNEYKGTIEVSQDVTGIRELKGEKRLLDSDEL